MRLGGRIQASVEVLNDIDTRNRPAADALKDWGLSNRFAGSGDRAAIGNIVYDVLRRRQSLGFFAQSDDLLGSVYALVLRVWSLKTEETLQALREDRFAPKLPSEDFLAVLQNSPIADAEKHIQGDIPQWCVASFEANFNGEWVREAKALAGRPSLDLRANTLKTSRDKLLRQLKVKGIKASGLASQGLRIECHKPFDRQPNIRAEEAYRKGKLEIQDEGSQIVSELVFARPGEKVLDFCAGAGGKSLAMAATMENKGQVHAWDASRERLAPIHERLSRAGTRNVQVHDVDDELTSLVDQMDKVLVDAPCTGSGVWRRRPDAKWRLNEENLAERIEQQEQVLSEAKRFVRRGGYLIYVTCSVFPEENENQVYAFIEDNPNFELVSAGEVWEDLFGENKLKPWSSDMKSITLTPAATNTDGFFFAVMERRG